MKLRRASRTEEKELLDFAGSYLSEDFPNSDREGCPPSSALRLLASRPREADLSVTEHIACCSACFKQYQVLLAEARVGAQAKRRNAQKQGFAGIVSSPSALVAGVMITAALALGTYVFIVKVERPKTAPSATPPIKTPTPPVQPLTSIEYSKFVLDLRALSPTRGPEGGPAPSKAFVRLPRAHLNLLIYLPLGSEEGIYRISLSSKNETVWGQTVVAQLRDRKILLEVKVDTGEFKTGNYSIKVESPSGMQLSQEISLQDTTGKMRKRQP